MISDVNPCPDSCTFDWVAFHTQLDIALAHLITDAKIGQTPPQEYMPSKTPIMHLLEYSNAHAEIEKAKRAKQ